MVSPGRLWTILRSTHGSHGGWGTAGPEVLVRVTLICSRWFCPQMDPVTIQEVCGRSVRNAVHVWSNIPAVRRYSPCPRVLRGGRGTLAIEKTRV